MKFKALQLVLASAMLWPVAQAQVKPNIKVQPSTQGLPTSSWADVRAEYSELDGLNDNDAVDVLHQSLYRHVDRATLAAFWQIAPPKILENKKLGAIDKWRFESCQDSATKAPTMQGVTRGLSICRERFRQLR